MFWIIGAFLFFLVVWPGSMLFIMACLVDDQVPLRRNVFFYLWLIVPVVLTGTGLIILH